MVQSQSLIKCEVILRYKNQVHKWYLANKKWNKITNNLSHQ